MAVERVRSRRDFVGGAELIMSVVELVDGLVVAIGEDGGLGVMRVPVVPLFGMIFGLNILRDVFRHGVERWFLLQSTVTTCAMLAAARLRLCGVVSVVRSWGMLWCGHTMFPILFVMGTILLRMRLVMALALDVL